MTLLGWQKLRKKICLLRACSNCKTIAKCDLVDEFYMLWDNGLLNPTTFFFPLVLFFTLDEVLSWWSILSSFMSANWGSIKYITEKARSCSQGGVGKPCGWLLCEQDLAPGTSCLLQRAADARFTAYTCSVTRLHTGQMWVWVPGCWAEGPPNHQSWLDNMAIFFSWLSISFFLPQTVHHLQAVLWAAAPHCGIRAPALSVNQLQEVPRWFL